jgi:hypothetical protein
MIRSIANLTGRRFSLRGAKQEDGEITAITVGVPAYRNVEHLLEFQTRGDAEQVVSLLLELDAFSSIEIVESHGIFVKRKA